MQKNLIAVAVAVLGLSAGAVGLAHARTDDAPAAGATTTTTAAAGARGPGGPRDGARGALGRTVHGDLVVKGKDGGFEHVVLDRGTLTSSDAGSLTLHRPDGVDVTVKLDGQTRYVGADDAAALHKDQPVTVVAKDGTARLVMQRDPEGAARRPGMHRPGGTPGGGPDGPPADGRVGA